MNNNYLHSEMNRKKILMQTFIAQNFWDRKILQIRYNEMCHTIDVGIIPVTDAPIVGSAYRISAYRCAIARIDIELIVADTADYRVAHVQKISSTDQMQGIKLTCFKRIRLQR